MTTQTMCSEWLCKRKAKFQSRKSRNYYCSEACAQIDSALPLDSIQSDQTALSSTAEHTEHCRQSSEDGLPSMNETKESGVKRMNTDTENTGKTQIEPVLNQGLDKVNYENADQSITDAWSANENAGVHPSQDSDKLLPIVEAESLDRPSLLDSSIRQLHGLMRDVGQNVQTKTRNDGYIDTALVNSACNCAKQMAALMKIKMDFAKIKSEKA